MPVQELPSAPQAAERPDIAPNIQVGGDTQSGTRPRNDETGSHLLASPVDDIFAAQADDDRRVVEDTLRECPLRSADGAAGQLDWPELKEKVRRCELCDLRSGCKQTVFGAGNEQADWLFVGEAPGADEDASGEPFTGQAGRLLDNMLLAIKLKRSEVYIVNVIKCRPPDDRHPHVGEIAACLPYLKRQIGLVKPKIIVALGRTAASALLNTDATIASLRGRVHDYNGHGHKGMLDIKTSHAHFPHPNPNPLPRSAPLSNSLPQAGERTNEKSDLQSLGEGTNETLRKFHIDGIPLIVTFHPAYLLRSPLEKARAWQDLRLAVATLKEVLSAVN